MLYMVYRMIHSRYNSVPGPPILESAEYINLTVENDISAGP